MVWYASDLHHCALRGAFWGHLPSYCNSRCPCRLRQMGSGQCLARWPRPQQTPQSQPKQPWPCFVGLGLQRRDLAITTQWAETRRVLIHASHLFPTSSVVFHCLRWRSFQIPDAAILARKWELHHGFIVCFRSSWRTWVQARGSGPGVWTNWGQRRSHMGPWLQMLFERVCFSRRGRILTCHLRKMPHQKEGLCKATAPRLLLDLRFWLVSDVGWGQEERCRNPSG